jgi:hypothetical protein
MSNWNSVKEITNWEGGTVRNELEWRTSSKKKLRATALQYFEKRVFLGRVIFCNSSNTATVPK